MSSTTIKLTPHDTTILSALFDAESKPSPDLPLNTSAAIPPLPHLTSPTLFTSLRRRETAALSPLHVPSPSPAVIATAESQLNDLIAEAPTYASAYMNRAQVRRLGVPADGLFTVEYAEETRAVLGNLGKAIDLATPSLDEEVSGYQKEVLAASHTHRGFLFMRAAEMLRGSSSTGADVTGMGGVSDSGVKGVLPRTDADGVEELAAKDFMLGARFGNKEARQMSVRVNPYAKMCGVIVRKALRNELDCVRELGL